MIYTGQDFIDKFELYKDDTTELSSDEELDLVNKILTEIYIDGPWEWLRKSYTGPTTEAGAISVPADFRHLMANYTEDETNPTMNQIVVYVGSTPYKVIPMAAATKYIGMGQYAYVDVAAKKIRFVNGLAQGTTVTFDYQYRPTAVTLLTSPDLPEDFHPMVIHAMSIDDDIIQIFERARSYAQENQAKYVGYMTRLRRYNNTLVNI